MPFQKTIALFCGTAAIAVSPSLAWAQTEPSAAAQQDDANSSAAGEDVTDIVVTAQKRSESINTVPLSITAASGEALEDLGIRDARDLDRIVPGLAVSQSQNNTPVFTLRGVGFQTQNFTSASPVGVYVDEVAYAYPYLANDVSFDLERVEVLKGPQGTLYGRSTTGGVVNYITAKPEQATSGSFSLRAGSYQSYGVEGHFTGPITDTLSFRVAGKVDLREKGWQRSVTRPNDRLGERNRKAIRGALLWEPSPQFEALLTVSHWTDKSEMQAPQAIAYAPTVPAFGQPAAAAPSIIANTTNARLADWTPDSYQPTAGFVRPSIGADSRFNGAALRMTYDLSDSVQIISLTGYNEAKRDDVDDTDGTALEIVSRSTQGGIKSFSQELRLAGDTGKLSWIVGGYYSQDKLKENFVSYLNDAGAAGQIRTIALLLRTNPGLAANILGVPAVAQPGFIALATANTAPYTVGQVASGFSISQFTRDGSFDSYAGFADVQYELSDTLTLGAGLRYTADRQKNAGCAADFNNYSVDVGIFFGTLFFRKPVTIAPNQCQTANATITDFSGLVNGRLNENNLSYRGVVKWTPRSDVLAYASYSRGYKAGTFPVVAANLETQLDPVTQERLDAIEVGVKAGLFDRKLQLNVAGFHYGYRDKQLYSAVPDIVFGQLTKVVNVPKSRIFGIDADLSWRVVPGVTARIGGTYLDTKIQSFQGFDDRAVPRNFAGAQLSYSPKLSGVAALEASFPVSSEISWNGVVSANYQSRQNSAFIGGVATPAQRAQDALLTIKPRTVVDLATGLSSENVDVQVLVRNLFDVYYYTTSGKLVDTAFRYAGMPRTFEISATFKF